MNKLLLALLLLASPVDAAAPVDPNLATYPRATTTKTVTVAPVQIWAAGPTRAAILCQSDNGAFTNGNVAVIRLYKSDVSNATNLPWGVILRPGESFNSSPILIDTTKLYAVAASSSTLNCTAWY